MERSTFTNLSKPEVFRLNPEDCSEEEFVDIITEEVWNLDEWTPEGIMMLKHFVFKMVTKDVPKDHDIDKHYFRNLVKHNMDW